MTRIEVTQKWQQDTNTEILTHLEGPGRYMQVKVYKEHELWTARMSLMPRPNKAHIVGESRALFMSGLDIIEQTATQRRRPIKFIAQTQFVSLIEMLKHLETTGKIQFDEPIHRGPQHMHIATITFHPR